MVTAPKVDAAAQRLVTLPEASELHDRPANYFTLRRRTYRYHAHVPFPLAVKRIGGFEVYDLHELLTWDEKRIRWADDNRGKYERTDQVRAKQSASAKSLVNDEKESTDGHDG